MAMARRRPFHKRQDTETKEDCGAEGNRPPDVDRTKPEGEDQTDSDVSRVSKHSQRLAEFIPNPNT